MLDTDTLHEGNVPPQYVCTPSVDVLIVDDSEFDLRRISRLISKIEHKVSVSRCKSLETFKVALDRRDYDICLIDHSLGGGKTSNDALELIKSHKTAAFTPAILISGTDDDKVIEGAIKSGFSSFVSKDNLTVKKLKQAVSDAIDGASSGDLIQVERQELVSSMMDSIAESYSGNTKPHIMKIYQYVNFMRSCLSAQKMPSIETLD